jgi:hypothetical protein
MKGYEFVKVPGGTNLLGLPQGMSLLENRHGSEFTVTYKGKTSFWPRLDVATVIGVGGN